MIVDGMLQFLAACAGTIGFSVLFSVPREHYVRCGVIGGAGWLVCWTLIHGFQMGTIEANFLATVFIALASRISSTVKKCPVTLFLIAGIFPEVPGIGVYRTIYYSILEDHQKSILYGRETLGIAIAMVLGIILVFEIPQKTIHRMADIKITGHFKKSI
nr:threonine/serine exporter family protein [uncultured Blautia sp.]